MLSQKAGKTKLLKVNNLLRSKWNISFFINQKDTKKPEVNYLQYSVMSPLVTNAFQTNKTGGRRSSEKPWGSFHVKWTKAGHDQSQILMKLLMKLMKVNSISCLNS